MILITGGTGYIGSHTCVELISAGYKVLVLDNCSNSSTQSHKRMEKITGQKIPFFLGNINDKALLRQLFSQFQIDAVVHFAGLKSVNDSIKNPLKYYNNNVVGSLVLFEIMSEFGCQRLVFSSSATVYGKPQTVPITEDSPLNATNPYGYSKLIIENILRDLNLTDPNWSIAVLRYFNPIGAHQSGLMGENPKGIPNNLVPFISQVAIGLQDKLKVFGGDFSTIDGTGVRDYIHVVDLAKGHVQALKFLEKNSNLITVNLGTGFGFSVLEIVQEFEKSGVNINYEIVDRRPGDIDQCYADTSLANNILNWKAELDIQKMCEDIGGGSQ